MKVKTLSRDASEFTRERPTDLQPVSRSIKPSLHPFEKAREYVRALNAVKLDKHFSKPFVGALEGHMDGVYTMARSGTELNTMLSGSCDGEIICWRLAQRTVAWRARAHTGFCRGVAFSHDGDLALSCGDDKVVRVWSAEAGGEPRAVLPSTHTVVDVHAHAAEPIFATAGTQMQLWDLARTKSVHAFTWGSDGFTKARFNPVERSILLGLSADRGITIHDIRAGAPLRKSTMQTRANAAAWNPMEAFNFVIASEDHNLYTFDTRKLDRALLVHEDHVGPVLDVDFAPTGRTIASGSYDRTVRVWDMQGARSDNVYHTRRMHRIFCVRITGDAKFVATGSDDSIVRCADGGGGAREARACGAQCRDRARGAHAGYGRQRPTPSSAPCCLAKKPRQSTAGASSSASATCLKFAAFPSTSMCPRRCSRPSVRRRS